MDLAADRPEHEDIATGSVIAGVREGRPDLGLLAGEGDERRRALDGDDRPRLHAIGAEQVPVVVVVDDDDRHQALVAHAGLHARDPIVANVHRRLSQRDGVGHPTALSPS